MDVQVEFKSDFIPSKNDLAVLFCFQTNNKSSKNVSFALESWPKDIATIFQSIKSTSLFKAAKKESFTFADKLGNPYMVFGLGEKKSWEKSDDSKEKMRRYLSACLKKVLSLPAQRVLVDTNSLIELIPSIELLPMIQEVVELSNYSFTAYKSSDKATESKNKKHNKTFQLYTKKTLLKPSLQAIQDESKKQKIFAKAANFCRDLANDPPNFLH